MNHDPQSARARAEAILARTDPSLREPRDPEVVARAAAWERDYDERNPRPAPPTPAPKGGGPVTKADLRRHQDDMIHATGTGLAMIRKQLRNEIKASAQTMAEIIGEEAGIREKVLRERIEALEAEHRAVVATLLMRVAHLEQALAGRHVEPIAGEGRHGRSFN